MRVLLMLLLLAGALPAWAEVRELSWEQMVPPGAPPPPPPTPIHDLSQMGDALSQAMRQQTPQAPVVETLNDQQVKLPGYIVPLDVGEDSRVSEFLFVPYFGACIHVPPPPSNQIVLVTSEMGPKMDDLYQPFWIEGRMRVEHSSNELADAGYRMAAEKIYPYTLPQ